MSPPMSRMMVLTVCNRAPTPTAHSPSRRVLSLMVFPSPNVSPSSRPIPSHIPAPSSSVLLDNPYEPRSLLDWRSGAGLVDPYDATLWRPESSISVPIRARDGEFQRFICDQNGCLGHQDPTSYPALLQRLRYDANRAKSCCVAWDHVKDINIRARYTSGPTVDIIDF